MNVRRINDWLSCKIPKEQSARFRTEITGINIGRAIATAWFFIFMKALTVPMFILAKRSLFSDYPSSVYISMALLMIIVMAIFIRIFNGLKNGTDNTKISNITLIIFTLFLQSWCAVYTLYNQKASGQILIYMLATMSIAIFPLYETKVLFPVYLSVHIVFVTLLPVFQKSPEEVYENSVSSTIIIAISLVISHYLYRNKCEDFLNKIMIEEKNAELYELNSRLETVNRQLEHLSVTDSLTGLLNRRKFDQIIKESWEYGKKNSLPISVIMMDVDLFKQYNDYYGHQIGDDCIVRIAGVISDLLRDSMDYAARYGGDEFIIILTQTETYQAYLIAETLRKKIEEFNIPLNDEKTEFVTVSLGVCSTIPCEESTITELITTADRALYQAKSQCRNKAVAFEL